MEYFSTEWFGYSGCWWVHPYVDRTGFGIDGKVPFTNRGITRGYKWI